MNYNDLTYWISVAHLKGWNVERINRMAVAVLHENEMNWADFFELEGAKKVLPHASFTAEKLQNAGKAALDFTDFIAKKSVKEEKVVVSGFAKGVDKEGNPVKAERKSQENDTPTLFG